MSKRGSGNTKLMGGKNYIRIERFVMDKNVRNTSFKKRKNKQHARDYEQAKKLGNLIFDILIISPIIMIVIYLMVLNK